MKKGIKHKLKELRISYYIVKNCHCSCTIHTVHFVLQKIMPTKLMNSFFLKRIPTINRAFYKIVPCLFCLRFYDVSGLCSFCEEAELNGVSDRW